MEAGDSFENPAYVPETWRNDEDYHKEESQDETYPFLPHNSSTPYRGEGENGVEM